MDRRQLDIDRWLTLKNNLSERDHDALLELFRHNDIHELVAALAFMCLCVAHDNEDPLMHEIADSLALTATYTTINEDN